MSFRLRSIERSTTAPREVAGAPTFSPMHVLGVLLLLLTLLALLPVGLPLMLASWSAILARPLQTRVATLVGANRRAAGVVTVVLVLVVLTPAVLVALSLVGSTVELFDRLHATEGGTQALSALFASDWSGRLDLRDTHQLLELVRRNSANALGAARILFGAVAQAGIALFVFVFAFYTFLVDGSAAYAWGLEHVPIRRAHFERLAAAFEETGRGLFIGLGGTALLQGVLAALGYLIIGVPRASTLGMLTTVASLVPILGTGLVWGPVALALFVLHHGGQALAVLLMGIVVSLLDNVARPLLSRYGKLQLPTFVIFIAMLGGLSTFGAAGALLGPLLVRLAVEALSIRREALDRAATPVASGADPARPPI